MVRAVRVTPLGSVGEVRVVSAPWREAAFIRAPRMALAMHDVPLRTPPESLTRVNDPSPRSFLSALVGIVEDAIDLAGDNDHCDYGGGEQPHQHPRYFAGAMVCGVLNIPPQPSQKYHLTWISGCVGGRGLIFWPRQCGQLI